ncbi:secreted protein [Candidatus Magnetobacterium bavaricum]|uniref:Secreted protein n=1 Tax=Candidatus Magnetobacterium bavaricum TaxID=29290 RepID=A0A0F3GYS8_9BACT|nr:secreted protein [Candidatus Magnetobacterium bavaricum]
MTSETRTICPSMVSAPSLVSAAGMMLPLPFECLMMPLRTSWVRLRPRPFFSRKSTTLRLWT